MQNQYAIHEHRVPVSEAGAPARAEFIVKTYLHLFGAILLFAAIEGVFFSTGLADRLAAAMLGTSWLLVLGGFVVVSWIASRAAQTSQSLVTQYAALFGFVLAEAIIFVPLLWIADRMTLERGIAGGIITNAAMVTLVGFGGLTLIAFGTRKDFSFLRGIMMWGGMSAMLLIGGSLIFGFNLGTWFSVGMIALAGAAILYDTSNIIKRYPEDRYVGAALQLFASVALMFWYVLRLFLAARD